ncbi:MULTISPECIES: TlpA family protein disulfide reductase [unclassified Pedobacter]|uniref:TlpA family protein disulfide reductase n=1 Tax=unclassified Pedobacter TaxID=2628915 RepID=UPI0014248850|nr:MULTISPECIES: redoxin domain-containing protein [unclassified Pedobacter]NII83410.1 thiol-disulfide isomerase/thioredoxin [Pedobacter sp. SG908]NMN37276.1 thiol-disulfide isomerase/thioredoxin [Pedobacter sp. SG918]
MKLRNLLLILLLAVTFQVEAQQPTLLPQFTFYKLDGKPFSNNDIKLGKKNLFILFDCTCEHCQRESKILNTNYAKFKDVNIYMITMDEAYIIPQFFNSYAKGLNTKPNVMVLQDKKRLFIPTFLPKQYPSMYLYSSTGKLLMYQSGDGGIKKLITVVNK